MTKLFPYLFLFSSIMSWAIDPVQDYLSQNTFPIKNTTYDGQLFAGEWSNEKPTGGYLFRFKVPLGPGGSLVTFVTSSFFVSKSESTWSAYQSKPGGSVLLGTDIGFSDMRFFLAPATADHQTILSEITGNKQDIYLNEVYIDNSGRWNQSMQKAESRDKEQEHTNPDYGQTEILQLVQKRHLGNPFVPRIEKILLAEYLKNPSAEWRICSDNHIYGEQVDPDEQSHLGAAENFSKEDAARMWNAERLSNTSR